MTSLAIRAFHDPSLLWAWLGNLKADKCHVVPDGAFMRWTFDWTFRSSIKLGPLEVIVDHELLTENVDHAWIGAVMHRGEVFNHQVVVAKDGRVW